MPPSSHGPVLIESFLDGSQPLRRPQPASLSVAMPGAAHTADTAPSAISFSIPLEGGTRGSVEAAASTGHGAGSTAEGEFGAEVVEWEERGVWYTPEDAALDEEGAFCVGHGSFTVTDNIHKSTRAVRVGQSVVAIPCSRSGCTTASGTSAAYFGGI